MNTVPLPELSFSSCVASYAHLPLFSFMCAEESRYVFLEPLVLIEANGLNTVTERTSEGTSFYESLERRLDYWKEAMPDSVPHIAGYFSYEWLNQYNAINLATPDCEIPCACFAVYKTVIRYDGEIPHASFTHHTCLSPFWTRASTHSSFSSQASPQEVSPSFKSLEELSLIASRYSDFTKREYTDAVERICSLIAEGNVYQVNLSQRFTIPEPIPPRALARAALSETLPPRAAFFHGPHSEFSLLSLSPELFFEIQGEHIFCRPIKGTTARDPQNTIDAHNAQRLMESEKDCAELAMIVDLIRNDFGRFCEHDSISVDYHAQLHSFKYVHHLVSQVSGRIPCGTTIKEILASLFPCGSITGAPKIAAMKYIDALEHSSRGIYTGSIGFFSTQLSHFNVAIRTVTSTQKHIIFGAGGGVTIDSDPTEEFLETLVKSRSLLALVERAKKKSRSELVKK